MSSRSVSLAAFAAGLLALAGARACAHQDSGGGSPTIEAPDASSSADAASAVEAGEGGEDDEGTFDDADDAGAASELDATAGDGGCNQADIEPNDTIATARPLASTTDCDSNGNRIRGTVGVAGDTDYFHFHGNDNAGCQVNPTAAIDVGGIRLCMYAKCDSPTGSTSCSTGTADDAPPAGVAGGCCIDGPATLEMKVDCPGLDDSSTIYLRASGIGATTCKTYAITYHY